MKRNVKRSFVNFLFGITITFIGVQVTYTHQPVGSVQINDPGGGSGTGGC